MQKIDKMPRHTIKTNKERKNQKPLTCFAKKSKRDLNSRPILTLARTFLYKSWVNLSAEITFKYVHKRGMIQLEAEKNLKTLTMFAKNFMKNIDKHMMISHVKNTSSVLISLY